MLHSWIRLQTDFNYGKGEEEEEQKVVVVMETTE